MSLFQRAPVTEFSKVKEQQISIFWNFTSFPINCINYTEDKEEAA